VNAYQLANSEFQAASLSNDLRMGTLPSRAVKATEVVESSQSINSVFNDIAKILEESFIQPILERVWSVQMQILTSSDMDELESILGKEKVERLKKIPAKERWARTVQGMRFKVFGVTQTLNKIREFQKVTALLQTISGNETLMEEFARRYDFAKILEVLMESLDINLDRIKLDEADQAIVRAAEAGGRPGMLPGATGPQNQTQIPAAGGGERLAEEPATEITPEGLA
jgi:hypothetical protein